MQSHNILTTTTTTTTTTDVRISFASSSHNFLSFSSVVLFTSQILHIFVCLMVILIPALRFVCLWGYDRSLENRTKCVDINKLYVKLTTRWMPLSESSINFYLRFQTNHSTSLIVFLSFLSTCVLMLLSLLSLFFLKMGHSRPLILYFRLFNTQLTVYNCSINK